MGITRRGLARAGAALTAAVVGIASGPPGARAAVRRVATLGATIRRGPKNAKGYARLVRGDGEPHVVRTGLGVPARAGRADRRRPLAAFVQLSDVHIVDVQSPLRVEWTDRFDDPGPTVTGVFASAYRPQEMLSGHIADAMVRRLNRIGTGPVTGRPLALAIQTGDNSDNSQYNEVRWNIDLLDGGRVRVDSGDLTTFEGVADDDPTWYDRAYWHPHGAPAGKEPRLSPASATASRSSRASSTPPAVRSAPPASTCRGTPCSATTTAWCRATSRPRRCS